MKLMGNCALREEDLNEVSRQYDAWSSLWHEVIEKLSDDSTFAADCAKAYQEECQKRQRHVLTKLDWFEITGAFVNRISCNDQRTKERIYSGVELRLPGDKAQPLLQDMFRELTRLALSLAERDLRERIAKLKEKLGGHVSSCPAVMEPQSPSAIARPSHSLSRAPAVLSTAKRSLDPSVQDISAVCGAILSGKLDVLVYNRQLELESKKLALNSHGRLSILRPSDGLCEDSWEVEKLRCISKGISSSILPEPPPASRALSFRFRFQELNPEEDRFLCVVFDSDELCHLALLAFSQLCGVRPSVEPT